MRKYFALTASLFIVVLLACSSYFLAQYQSDKAVGVRASVFVAGIPSVVSTTPSLHANGVAFNSPITVDFSEAVDQASITADSFVVIGNQTGRRSLGNFAFSNGDTTVQFTPTDGFDFAGEKVSVTLTNAILSAATGDPLDGPYIFTYTVNVPNGFANFGHASSTLFNNDQSLGVRPSDVKLGDLNGDGNLDLVISNMNGGLERWLGDGLGGFASPVDIVISEPGLQGHNISLAPMNDDDYLDIIFVHLSNDIEIHLNDGSGNFNSEMTVDLGGNNVSFGDVAAGDFNGDGLMDFAVSQYFSGNVIVFLNNGSQLVYDAAYAVTASSLEIYAADLDNDYDLDLIIEGGATTDAVGYLLNDGSANFAFNSTDANFGTTDHVVVDQFLLADDFNHFLIANDALSFGTNDGSASFTWSQPDVIFNDGIREIISGDLDGDDDPDIVAFTNPGFNDGWYEILLNNSAAAPDFSAKGQIPVAEHGTDAALADLDKNGVLDMVSIHEGAPGTFEIWMGGQFAPAAITDLDGAPGNGKAVLTWSEPNDGGSPITDYVIEYGETSGWPGNATVFDDGISDIPESTVTGLVNGIDYTFVVYAVNAIGTGDVSNETNTTPIDTSNWTEVVIDQRGNIAGTDSDMVAIDEDNLYASYRDEDNGQGYFAFSENGGFSWDQFDFDADVFATSIDATASGTAYISYAWDGGGPLSEVWVWTTDDSYIGIHEDDDVDSYTAITVVDDNTFFVAYSKQADGQVYVTSTTNAGGDLTEVAVGPGYITSPHAIDAFDENTIYLLYRDDLDGDLQSAVTTNGGANWTLNDVDTVGDVGFGHAIKVIDELTAYAVYTNDTDQTLMFAKTTDGGATWETSVIDSTGGFFEWPSIDATDADHIFAAAPNNLDFQYFFSIDGGDTWDITTHIEPDGDDSEAGFYSAIDAIDPSLAYVTGYRASTGEFVAYRIAAQGLQDPLIIYPQDQVVVTRSTPVLSAWYTDSAQTGTTEYRISSSSLVNCVNGVDIVDFGTSAVTESLDQPTTFEASGLVHGETYYWCARNDNGTEQTDWTSMGEFTVNLLHPAGVSYSTFLGGSDDDWASAISVEGGDIYVSGGTASADFPATLGAYDTSLAGTNDVFVAKISPDGAGDADLIYATYIGGTDTDAASPFGDHRSLRIKVVAGEVYAAGTTASADFPTSLGAYDSTSDAGALDGFVFRLAADGSNLLYSTYIGGTLAEDDYIGGIDVGGGIIYVAGSTLSSDFPTTSGAYDESANGMTDIFLALISPDGNGAADLQYATIVGTGTGSSDAVDVEVDSGNAYILGYTTDSNFPTTAQAMQTTYGGGPFDDTLTIIDPSGNGSGDLVYSTFLGGDDNEDMLDLEVDQGIAYIAGLTNSTNFPTTAGAYSSSFNGNSEAVAVIIDPSSNGGDDLVYSTFIGGDADEAAYGIVVLPSGSIAIAGETNSSDFVTSTGESITDSAAFLAILDPSGNGQNDLTFSTQLDGEGADSVYSLHYDGVNLSLAGITNSADFVAFATGGDAYDVVANGGTEAFFISFEVDSELDPATVPPEAPTRVYPDEGATRAGVVILASNYTHSVLTGTTQFRVSSGSAADCLANVNIEASGTSSATNTKNAITYLRVSTLSNGIKYWCARNDNGTTQSDWTTMGSFIQDSGAPYLNYSTYFGGSAGDSVNGFDVENGIVYVAGSTDSVDFPVTAGVYDETFDSTDHSYVAAFSLDGNGAGDLQFATYFGGNATTLLNSLDFADDKIYLIGETHSTDIPYIADGGGVPFDNTADAGAFILRFNNDASVLEYSTRLMPRGIIGGDEIRVENGLVYAVGPAQLNLPTTAGAYDTTQNGSIDFYVMVLDLAGNGANDLLYSTYLGGGGFEALRSIDVHDGIVYLAGYSDTGSYPVTVGAFDTVKAGFGTEGVVSVLDPSGNGSSDLLYSTFMGGNDQEVVMAVIHHESTGHIYGCGSNGSGDMTITAGAYKSTSDDDGYMFVLDPGGNGAADLVYGSYGGNCSSAFLRNDDLYMLRVIDATFPITAGAYSNNINQDGFGLLRFSLDGNGSSDLVYGTRIGDAQVASSLIIEGDNIYFASETIDSDLESAAYPSLSQTGTPFSDQIASTSAEDGYITRIYYPDGATPPSSSQGTPAQVIQHQSLNIPNLGEATVLSHDRVQYEWSYAGSNHEGFHLLDAQNRIIATIASPQARQLTEEGLGHNTLISGRKIAAYLGSSMGTPSGVYPDVYTWMPEPTPIVTSRTDTNVEVSVVEAINNLTTNQSAIQFELVSVLGQTQAQLSDWIQTTSHTFSNLEGDQEYSVRVRARNADGVITDWSSMIHIPALSADEIVVLPTIRLMTLSENELPGIVVPHQSILVEASVRNAGAKNAHQVILNVPLPKYVSYTPRSLRVDGTLSSETGAADPGLANQNGISASWAMLEPGQSHAIRFEIALDTAALLHDFSASEASAVLAQANPLIQLQASVNHAGITEPIYSNIADFEVDIASLITPKNEPEPDQEPESQPEVLPRPIPEPTEDGLSPQYLQQLIDSLNQPEPQSPSMPSPAQTTVSTDGQSFNIEVTDDSRTVLIDGLADQQEEGIAFSGSTSEPNSVVTLIFNGLISVSAVSDTNGVWQAYVSAQQLGAQPGEPLRVSVEAIAVAGDLRSERVQVGEFTLTIAKEGEVQTDFETVVSSSELVTAIKTVTKEVQRVVEQREEEIQQTLAVAAPVVVISSAPLWGYLPYLPTLLYHAITYLVGLVGRRKKGQQRFFGIAYDAITKDPLALAIVRLYKKDGASERLVSTFVTDKQGKYDALLEPGSYRIEVKKPQYTFPSSIVTGTSQDGQYDHVYMGGVDITDQTTELVVPDLPMDPVNAEQKWQTASLFKKLWLSLQKAGQFLALPLLFVGSLASVMVVAAVPENPVNWILSAAYILLFMLQLTLRHKPEKAWGTVYDIATNAPLPLVNLQLIDPAFGKVVASRLSDYQGRFRFAPEPGKYVLKAEKPGFTQSEIVEAPKDRQPLPTQISIQKEGESVKGDIGLRRS